MKKIIIFSILLSSLLFFVPNRTEAQSPRYAECDACGYCQNKQVPSSWEACRDCLYPTLNGIPATNNSTLAIITDPTNPNANRAIPPKKGAYYTQLGCIDTSIASFSDPTSAGGVLNFLLNKLIFPTTGVLAFVFLIYGSFLLITAQGAQYQIAKGKKYISGSIIGLIFTFSAILLVNIVGSDILRIPGLSKGVPIIISAASNCLDTKGGTETICPIMKIQIRKNYAVLETGMVGEVPTFSPGYPVRPDPSNFKTYSYQINEQITSTNIGDYQIGILYEDDESNHMPSADGSFRDKNIYIQSLKIAGKKCTSMTQGRWHHSGSLVFITNNGFYDCLTWQ